MLDIVRQARKVLLVVMSVIMCTWFCFQVSLSSLVTLSKACYTYIVTCAGDISSKLLVILDVFAHTFSAGCTLLFKEATKLFLFWVSTSLPQLMFILADVSSSSPSVLFWYTLLESSLALGSTSMILFNMTQSFACQRQEVKCTS